MKHKFLSLILVALVAAAPLFGQSQKDDETEMAEPATGVRFVNCSPSGITIPSPLYCKAGKSSREIRISPRMPSARVKPIGTTIDLYDQDPGTTTDQKTPAAQQNAPKPVISLEVPADMTTGKVLCILIPTDRDNPFKVKPMYVKESAFPKNGVHIINFTARPLQIKLWSKDDHSDTIVSKIGSYKGGISSENTWSSPSGSDGQQFSFILSAMGKTPKELRRIKASRFAVSSRQSQINLVVKDPQKDSYKLLSIQLSDKKNAK